MWQTDGQNDDSQDRASIGASRGKNAMDALAWLQLCIVTLIILTCSATPLSRALICVSVHWTCVVECLSTTGDATTLCHYNPQQIMDIYFTCERGPRRREHRASPGRRQSGRILCRWRRRRRAARPLAFLATLCVWSMRLQHVELINCWRRMLSASEQLPDERDDTRVNGCRHRIHSNSCSSQINFAPVVYMLDS